MRSFPRDSSSTGVCAARPPPSWQAWRRAASRSLRWAPALRRSWRHEPVNRNGQRLARRWIRTLRSGQKRSGKRSQQSRPRAGERTYDDAVGNPGFRRLQGRRDGMQNPGDTYASFGTYLHGSGESGDGERCESVLPSVAPRVPAGRIPTIASVAMQSPADAAAGESFPAGAIPSNELRLGSRRPVSSMKGRVLSRGDWPLLMLVCGVGVVVIGIARW
jgi:hypothetical protein